MGLLDTFGIPWTESQRQALDIHVNTAVTAGAGSGKTQVLSARYLLAAERLIALREYHGPEHILVLTFTDKAAAEMRERIGAAIQNYLRGSDFNRLEPQLKDRWLRFYADLPVERYPPSIRSVRESCVSIVEAGLIRSLRPSRPTSRSSCSRPRSGLSHPSSHAVWTTVWCSC